MTAKSILGFGNKSTAGGLREATVLLHAWSIPLVSALLGLLLDALYEASVKWSKFSERPQRHLVAGAHVLWGEAEDTGIVQPGRSFGAPNSEFPISKRRSLKRWSQAFHQHAWGENNVNWNQGSYKYVLDKGKKKYTMMIIQYRNTCPEIQWNLCPQSFWRCS